MVLRNFHHSSHKLGHLALSQALTLISFRHRCAVQSIAVTTLIETARVDAASQQHNHHKMASLAASAARKSAHVAPSSRPLPPASSADACPPAAPDNDEGEEEEEEEEELSLEDLRRKLQRREEDAPYLRAIDDVVRRRLHGDTPCELLPELLLSNWAEADKPAELAQAWQVTHVFSCIEGTYLSREAAIERYAAAGITYDGVAAEDDEEYSMLPRHFARFRSFVAPLRRRREAGGAGRCLVHCAGGMNRSGVLAVAYAMESRRWPLLDAVAHCAGARGPILWNAGFQQELVDFARENDLLVERQQQRRHEEQEEMITR